MNNNYMMNGEWNSVAGSEYMSDKVNDYFARWNPTVQEDTCNGPHEVQLLTKHFTNRKLFINGEVTEEMANDFVSKMLYLCQSDEPIDIYLNSPGGSVNAGLVIYDILQDCSGDEGCEPKIPINIYCTGLAASMGAVILAGGQKGRRFILPHSKVMIHEPLIAGGMGGSATSIKKTAESILETKTIINGILAKHTGKTVEEVDEATSFDNYMNAEEAISFGLCDSISKLF